MKRLITLLLLAVPLIAATTPVQCAEALPIQFEILGESQSDLHLRISFPEPNFKACTNDDGRSGLLVEFPEATPDFDAGLLTLPVFTKLVAVPAGYRAEVRVRNSVERSYGLDALIPRDQFDGRPIRSLAEETPTVEVGDPVWMRWLRVAPVVIRPVRYDAVSRQIIAVEQVDLEFTFSPDGRDGGEEQPDVARYWSLAFDEFFRGMLLNPGVLPAIPADGLEATRGTYLIMTTDSLARHAQKLADWKRRKGFNVVVEPIAHDRSLSPDVVRDYIDNAYHTWERPPEFVLMLGDVDRGNQYLPAYRIRAPFDDPDVTDHPFTMVQGDDYFPDLFIGRMAVDAATETINATRRVIRYEQDSTGASADRYHRSTLFAGNFADNGNEILTPVATSEWLEGLLRDRGWDIDTFYYRGPGYQETKTIVESINRGVNLVSYRGWGNVTGTHRPPFYIYDLQILENGPHLPLMTFFVCNTADFGNLSYDKSFGDWAITGGTAFNPAGAIAFIGVTDLHTETRVNNPMCAGFYSGALFENQRNVSALMLRGKMEIWRNMPLSRERQDNVSNVWFYFNVYTLLGDPELNYFLDPPVRLRVQAPQSLAVGSREASFVVRDANGWGVKGAVIHLAGRGVDYTILTDRNGDALASPHLTDADTLQVTIVGQQLSPWFGRIPVIPAQRMIALDGYRIGDNEGGSAPISESTIAFRLKNLGHSDESNIAIHIASLTELCTVIDSSVEVASIVAGRTEMTPSVRIRIEPYVENGYQIPLALNIDFGTGQNRAHVEHIVRLPVRNSTFSLAHTEMLGQFLPREITGIVLSLLNTGEAADGVFGTLDSFDEALEIVENHARFGFIGEGDTVLSQDTLRLRIREGVTIGRQIQLRLILRNQAGLALGSIHFPITVGAPGPRNPLGPDGYGYYAYENTDNHPNAPRYDWLELDPMFGGANSELRVMDDEEIVRVDLPFNFKFYGEEYSQITICSNGWISFEDAAFPDFVNQPLPSPLGPRGLIAPYWDDLIGERRNVQRDSLRVLTRNDQGVGRFTIEWSRVMARSSIGPMRQTFEVVLYHPAVRQTPTGDGEILFQYQEARLVSRDMDPNYATVGIEDWGHNRGLEITYSGLRPSAIDTLTGGRAILFTTVAPDTFLNAARRPERTLPTELRLDPPSPNPFNQQTNIRFALPHASHVKVTVLDLSGREIQVLVDDERLAGEWTASLSAGSLTSGVYLIKLDAARQSRLTRAVLLR